jgi:hypothetical protein
MSTASRLSSPWPAPIGGSSQLAKAPNMVLSLAAASAAVASPAVMESGG